MIELQTDTITLPPSELLRQVATFMNGRDTEISVTVPVVTTWKTVLRATDSALGELDGSMTVTVPRTEAQRRRLRQIALGNVAAWDLLSSKQTSPGRPIRTKYDMSSLPMPKPASKETLQRLKEDMMPSDDFRDPYPVVLTAAITERTLPIVKANLILRGIDSTYSGGAEELNSVEMLWDTGAQQTIITEDLLSEPFRQYLQDPSHDSYRSGDKIRVQLDAIIALSNTPIKITAIALVVPSSVVPKQRVGVIFGQKHCIDCMSYRSIPRRILKAKGEDVDDEIWGDLVVDEFVNEDGNVVFL
jgi:hypothetical protein